MQHVASHGTVVPSAPVHIPDCTPGAPRSQGTATDRPYTAGDTGGLCLRMRMVAHLDRSMPTEQKVHQARITPL